jgi:hypothetical protein
MPSIDVRQKPTESYPQIMSATPLTPHLRRPNLTVVQVWGLGYLRISFSNHASLNPRAATVHQLVFTGQVATRQAMIVGNRITAWFGIIPTRRSDSSKI